MQDVFTANEIAELLGITTGRVYQLARDRKLGDKRGKFWLFTQGELRNLKIRINGRPRKRGK